jgi:hypothetical protein
MHRCTLCRGGGVKRGRLSGCMGSSFVLTLTGELSIVLATRLIATYNTLNILVLVHCTLLRVRRAAAARVLRVGGGGRDEAPGAGGALDVPRDVLGGGGRDRRARGDHGACRLSPGAWRRDKRHTSREPQLQRGDDPRGPVGGGPRQEAGARVERVDARQPRWRRRVVRNRCRGQAYTVLNVGTTCAPGVHTPTDRPNTDTHATCAAATLSAAKDSCVYIKRECERAATCVTGVGASRSTARLSTGRAAVARAGPHSHPANPVSMVTAGREQRPGAEGTPLIGPPSLSASLWLPPPLSRSRCRVPLAPRRRCRRPFALCFARPAALATSLLARVALGRGDAPAGVASPLSSRRPVQMARAAGRRRRHPRPRPMTIAGRVSEGQGYVKGVHRSEPRGEHRLT